MFIMAYLFILYNYRLLCINNFSYILLWIFAKRLGMLVMIIYGDSMFIIEQKLLIISIDYYNYIVLSVYVT